MEIGEKGRRGGADTGGIRNALGKDSRSNTAGSNWMPTVDDTRTGQMDVVGVHGTGKADY